MKALLAAALVLGAGVNPNDAAAQARARSIEVVENQPMEGVTVELELRRRTETRSEALASYGDLKVGEMLVICFKASESGYVTLWNQIAGSMGKENRPLLPNQFAARAEPVEAGVERCVGDTDAYSFEVSAPVTDGKVMVHWTRTLEDAVPADAYPAPVRSVSGRQEGGPPKYATRTVRYTAN